MRVVGAAVTSAVLCAGLLAGCSQEPGPTPVKERPQLSEEEFVTRANEICRRAGRELDRRGDNLDTSTSAKARRAVRSVIVPNIREQVADVRALRGPARLEKRLTPILEDADRVLDFIAEDPSRFADSELLFKQVNQGLTGLGLTVCGS